MGPGPPQGGYEDTVQDTVSATRLRSHAVQTTGNLLEELQGDLMTMDPDKTSSL